MTVPTGTVSPSLTTIFFRVPASSAGISVFALSVSISAIISAAATVSPSCLIQRRILPSSIPSPILGIRTSTMITPQPLRECALDGCDDVLVGRDGGALQVLGVGHRHVGAGDALDGRVQLIECLLIDTGGQFRAYADISPLFLCDHRVVRLADTRHDGAHVEGNQCPQVDHFAI